MYVKFDENGEYLAHIIVDTKEPMQLEYFEELPASFLNVENFSYIRKVNNEYIIDSSIKLFVKFDENGKLVSFARFNRLNEIKPSAEGFEQTEDVSDEDILYLIKKDGVIQIDEERKTVDAEKKQIGEIRSRRSYECFPIINRGSLWYNKLTAEQKTELSVWYEAWLDAPATKIIPSKPLWIK